MITVEMINSAITKVERVNNIELSKLKDVVSDRPEVLVTTFNAMVKVDSIDDRYAQIANQAPQLLDHAHHLLEASIILQ
ncbi:hypothetical protein [Vibrio sp. WXL103]|uniref:hypothetical protein n=1 Tax=Vibrio sp. WXL103 TaxID=3450710 RepID=UPI003EC4FAA3